MSEALGAVARLLHRTQSHRADDAFLRSALDFLEDLLDIHRLDVAGFRRMDKQAECP